MKTPVKLLLLVLALSGKLNAQLSNYLFSSESRTYVPITGTQATYSSFDDGRTGLLPIGFSFDYNGTNYTELEASTNGYVKLGNPFANSFNMSYNDLSLNPDRPILAPLWDDLAVFNTGAIRYETTGTTPNRVFTLQWSQMKWTYNANLPSIEFQLKLHETTNKIEFTYNQLSGAVSGAQGLIGISAIATGTGNYLSLTNTSASPSISSTTQTYVTTRPATNQVYTFFRPMLCTGTPVGGTTISTTTTVCPSTDFILSVQGSTLATGLTYQWRWSDDGNTWNTIIGATDDSLTTSQTADRYYTRFVECAGNSSSSTPIFVTTAELTPSYASLPFTETFEATWISNCAMRELPGANWKNTPVTGQRSWRREDDPNAAGWDYKNGWIGGSSSHAARFKVRDEYSTTDHGTGNLDLYVNCSGAGTKELRFKHIVTNAYSPLTVLYSTDGGTNFTSLGKIRGISQWREHNFVIPSNSVTTVIRFQGAGAGYSGSSDVGLDDVRVLVVTCNFPTGLMMTDVQQTSATANWLTVAGASGYEYHISTNPIPPASGTFTTALSTDISGLTTTTNYYVHVRTKCSSSDFSSWSSKAFTTSTDCSVALPMTCGTPRTFSVADGSGVYDLSATDTSTNCTSATFGKEQLLRFAPQISGVYSLKINSTTANYATYYYIKDAAQGCSPLGWKCLGNSTTATTFSLGNLSAGKEYFIMVDLYTIVNGHSETLEIICPATNADCIPITISPANTVMCAGTAQVLSTNAGLTGYQWYRNGVAINGATSNTYSASLAGVYTVAATNLSCTSLPGSPTYLTINSSPAPPVITAVGNVLTSSYASGNQWYLNGSLISGATDQSFTATTGGVYSVQVTVNGCSSTSVNFNLVPTAVDNVSIWGKELSVFPNPVESTLNIKNPGNKKLKLQLVDGIGRIVYEGNLNYSSGSIDMKRLPGGAYQLLITDVNKKQTVSKLILKN